MTSSAIELQHVKKRFSPGAGEKPFAAIKDISLSIAAGSFTVICGANGSGKSVLMQLIAGLMKPTAGSIRTSSRPGLVFQDASTQILGETAREDVSVGPRNAGLPKKEIPAIVDQALKAVSLTHKADFAAEFLSGGEKRRLAVAAILAMKRDIIIFDEPYANLDWPGVRNVNTLLSQLRGEGKTLLLLTHELEKCLGFADHLLILKSGSLVFDGSPEEALAKPTSQWDDWSIRNPLTSYSKLSDLIWR